MYFELGPSQVILSTHVLQQKLTGHPRCPNSIRPSQCCDVGLLITPFFFWRMAESIVLLLLVLTMQESDTANGAGSIPGLGRSFSVLMSSSCVVPEPHPIEITNQKFSFLEHVTTNTLKHIFKVPASNDDNKPRPQVGLLNSQNKNDKDKFLNSRKDINY